MQRVLAPVAIAASLASLVPAIAPTADLAAQSSADARLLDRLDAALDHGTAPELPDASDGEARQLQRGLLEMQRYALQGNRPAIEAALFRFDLASIRRRDWAWPEYAMARAFRLLDSADAPLLESEGSQPGELQGAAMWRHLLAALRLDPRLAGARRMLVRLTYPAGDRTLTEQMAAALAIEVGQPDASPDALIAWARYLRANRDYDSSRTVLARAGASGGDRSVLALELARTDYALGRADVATEEYWDGVRHLTTRGRDLYRQDLGWILLPDSLASFDAVSDTSVAGWLGRFWGERAAAAVEQPEARLREHLRRWVYVHERYRVTFPELRAIYSRVDIGFEGFRACIGNATQFYEELPIKPVALPGDPRANEPLLDHRALVYMKHGEPFARVAPSDTTALAAPEEPEYIVPDKFGNAELAGSLARTRLWAYWIEGRWRVFSFAGSHALGMDAGTTLTSYLRAGPGAWEALARVLPDYRAAANRVAIDAIRLNPPVTPTSCQPEVTLAVQQQRTDATVGIHSDTEWPPIARPWNSTERFFALGRGVDRTSRAMVTFAVPLSALQGEPLTTGQVAWRLRFHLVAYRPADGTRIDVDTTRVFATRGIPEHGQVTGWFELPLEPGSWQVAVLVRQPQDTTAGGYALRRGLVLDSGAGLSLSDVVTGRNDQPGWRAPDGPFPVNALGTWRRGEVLEVWYQVGGLTAGESYRTTLEVLPTDKSRSSSVRVTTTDRAAGAVATVRKSVGLEQLEPGSYRLIVTVEANDRTVSREQEILVITPPPPATGPTP